jgi:hypothetical protein
VIFFFVVALHRLLLFSSGILLFPH